MKYLLCLLLVMAGIGDLNKIAEINKAKKAAAEAYQKGDYAEAIKKYNGLVKDYGIDDDTLHLNLANAYYKVKDTTEAHDRYKNLLDSKQESIRSVAHQQIGLIEGNKKNYQAALGHFKKALKSDPHNEEARYNYELIKKLLREQEQQDQQNQENQSKDKEGQKDQKDQQKQGGKDEKDQQGKGDKDQKGQQKEDPQGEEKKNGDDGEEQSSKEEGEKDPKGKEPPQEKESQQGQKKEGEQKKNQDGEESNASDEEKASKEEGMPTGEPQKMKEISEQKARLFLNDLRQREVQFFQQNRRKATKRKDTDKPDW